MLVSSITGVAARRAVLLAVVMGAAVLSSAPAPRFTPRDKAFYKDAAIVNFVRPGLVLKILSANIANDGTITATFTLADPAGLALDRLGISTPGAVSVSFIAATIPTGQTQYTAYTTRVQTSPITGVSATQAGTDASGVFAANPDGSYSYTFKTKAPASIDRTATHSIGAYASRDLTAFDMGTQYSNDVFNFVPNGAQPTVIRDVVETSSCNQCHDPLSAHGGARQQTQLCVLCHQPQTIDPDTGNTVDFKVMIHKIHMGSSLPSVVAGKPYQIIGFNQSVSDFSTVVFPSDVRNCTICHTPTATQNMNYITKASAVACGSCHDDVDFPSGKNHAGGPQPDDSQCTVCHIAQTGREFDASILGGHTIPLFSKDLPGTTFGLVKVDNGTAGMQPTVTFTLNDKAGNPIDPASMTRLALVIAGPTTDYVTNVTENVTKPTGGNGTYQYTFQYTIPADATGTYTVGIEGYKNITLQPNTTNQQVVRDAGINKTLDFSVDGSRPVSRRTVVDIANCNVCHTFLSPHGNNRNQIHQCVLCHSPTQTDSSQRPASAAPNQAINFAQMIHKIHTGTNLTVDYTIYGFGGSKVNFNGVLFPGDRRDCEKCHVNNSEQLPIGATLQVTDPRGPINPIGPIGSACTGCHTDVAVASHVYAQTTPLGESCDVCHGQGAEFSVSQVHAR